MKARSTSVSLLSPCSFSMMVALWAVPVWADLQIDINRILLRESAADTSRTDHEKLFVYRCETIAKTIGFSGTPTGQATKYSCDVPAVGIAFYAGSDLGKHPPEKVGQHFPGSVHHDTGFHTQIISGTSRVDPEVAIERVHEGIDLVWFGI